MSRKQIYIVNELEVEDDVENSNKASFGNSLKKNNIKNWSFKTKNSVDNDKAKTSDTNKITDNNSYQLTLSTEKKDCFLSKNEMINFSNYTKINSCDSIELFSYCDASVGNSNHINVPQEFAIKNNFLSSKRLINKKNNDVQVIDLTDSLSEIPEEIFRPEINGSGIAINIPSEKMQKYYDNNVGDKMIGFSAKKNEIDPRFFAYKELKYSDKDMYRKISDAEIETENFNINDIKQKKVLQECYKKVASLKFNNVDTQTYFFVKKKNSDCELDENLSQAENNVKTEENEDNIEDETLMNKLNNKNMIEENSNHNIQSQINSNNITSERSTSTSKQFKSHDQGIKILKTSNNVFLEGSKSDLKTDDFVYDNSIKIIKYLSEGAQARVYLGHIEEINKYVAIKRYTIIENDNDLINKIHSECEFIKSLDHPNIIKYYDIDISYRNSFITIDLIMEYVEGLCLKDYVNSEDFIYLEKEDKQNTIIIIIKNILSGIEYLHANKIIHRDLKPENVIVSSDLEDIKIVDFGISTKVKDSETFKARSVLGTPYYMAPEVILEKPYAFEADIWSIGCILYELVSSVRPYNDNNPFNAMLKMAQYTSPLEYANDEIKDIFYDKGNRNLLDFLQKCWRANNMFRPSAKDLLEHRYLNS